MMSKNRMNELIVGHLYSNLKYYDCSQNIRYLERVFKVLDNKFIRDDIYGSEYTDVILDIWKVLFRKKGIGYWHV